MKYSLQLRTNRVCWDNTPSYFKRKQIIWNIWFGLFIFGFRKIDHLMDKIEFVAEGYETLQDQIVWRDLCFVIDQEKDFEMFWI